LKFFYSKGGKNGNPIVQSRSTVWDQQEPLRTRIGQVTGQFSSDVKLSGPFLVGFKPGILLLPYPLPKINPVIDNRRFLVRGFPGWRYSPDQDAKIFV
jgi:hypothetical protein